MVRMADPDPDKCVKEAAKPHHNDEKTDEHEPLADRAVELVRLGLRCAIGSFPVAQAQAGLERAT